MFVREDVVGRFHFFEFALGFFAVVGVAVGVQLHGELAVGPFEFFLGCVFVDAEDFVEVFVCHEDCFVMWIGRVPDAACVVVSGTRPGGRVGLGFICRRL